MTIFQAHWRGNQARRPAFLTAVAVVCLLLVTVLAVAQVAHIHSNPSDAYTCPLCVAMHTVVPAVAVVAPMVAVQVGVPVPIDEARALTRYWHPKLFTRPPPAA